MSIGTVRVRYIFEVESLPGCAGLLHDFAVADDAPWRLEDEEQLVAHRRFFLARALAISSSMKLGRGGSVVLHTGQGAPAPHSQASSRSLRKRHGRSGCVSQTQPVPSQRAHFTGRSACSSIFTLWNLSLRNTFSPPGRYSLEKTYRNPWRLDGAVGPLWVFE